MIAKELLDPKSIVVVGASADIHKPGGKVLLNLMNSPFKGQIYAVNPKEAEVQGVKCYAKVDDLPQVDCAILAIAAKYCPATVDTLALQTGTKGFIIISAGFGEENEEGAAYEKHIADTINSVGGSLIGPICTGFLNTNYCGAFDAPIPTLDPHGVDFITGSGATAVFIKEYGISNGLTFNSVWAVGNSAQVGIEDVLEHLDETFDPEKSSRVIMLYMEKISDPQKMLKHARSLINKGCKIAAIKSGGSAAGSRAASSHTGALATSDVAVDALFRKAGIVRCFSREELTTVGCIFTLPKLNGKRFAIVTHAGGPGVMLTDALSKGGLQVPKLEGEAAEELKAQLFPGSSVANPIDILATGTPEHLGIAIDYCEKHFDNIDAIMVIFGTPGLVTLYEAYDMLHKKILECTKPIFPVLPSLHTAGPEVEEFLKKGHVNFSDEVTLATALTQIMKTPAPAPPEIELFGVDVPRIREIISIAKENGYLDPDTVRQLFACAGIPMVPEMVSMSKEELVLFAEKIGYPVVAKVVGPVHKSDVGGVALNIRTAEHLSLEFDRMMQIPDASAVMVQKMMKGTELFVGAKYEERFGHVVLCGLGGIFVEVLKDVQSGLAPLSYNEAYSMIRSLRGYKIIKGTRGQKGINEQKYAEIIVRLSTLLRFAREIKEMDINPLLADENNVVAVDARIRIEKD